MSDAEVVATVERAVRVEVAPPPELEARFFAAAGARRVAYNWAVEQLQIRSDLFHAQREADVPPAERKPPLGYYELLRRWNKVKHTRFPWHAEHSTWVYSYAIQAAADAHRRFLRGEAGFPTFKARAKDPVRFSVRDGLRLQPGWLRAAKYGWVPISHTCPAQKKLRRLVRRGRAKIRKVTVTHTPSGRWVATVHYARFETTPQEQRRSPAGPPVGVDRGVASAAVAATADGTETARLQRQRHLERRDRAVRRRQRRVARTQPGSANRAKRRRELAVTHRRAAAARRDALEAFTAELAREHRVVVVEDLQTKNLLGNRRLSRAISEQGWGHLRQLLEHKTAREGGVLVVADRFYPSSKTCARCGAVRSKLSLSERTFTCGCGHISDRDVNAAANLAALAEASASAGDRHPGGPTAPIGGTPVERAASSRPADAPAAAGALGEPGTPTLAPAEEGDCAGQARSENGEPARTSAHLT